MQTLTGRRAVITGGGSGIGRALALELARAGAEVLIADRDEAAAAGTVEAVRAAGGRARAYAVDVTDPDGVAAFRRQVIADGGPIDVLVNNAGVVHGGAFLDVPLDRHLATYRVNTSGVVIMTHAFLGDLVARPESHLVQIASASALVGLPYGSTYGSSKWATLGFSESIRLELAALGHRHVGVTAVCPGYVRTGMFDGVRSILLTPVLTPERVARKTVRAVLRNRPRVLMPWMVTITPLLSAVLPRRLFDLAAALFGVTTSMSSWRGRGPSPPASSSKRG